MRTGLSSVLLGAVLVIVSGCADSPGRQGNAIRVRNDTGVELHDVFVEGISFGTLVPSEVTSYEEAETLYEVLWYSGTHSGKEFGQSPADREGNDATVRGRLTVVVSTVDKNGETKIKMGFEPEQ